MYQDPKPLRLSGREIINTLSSFPSSLDVLFGSATEGERAGETARKKLRKGNEGVRSRVHTARAGYGSSIGTRRNNEKTLRCLTMANNAVSCFLLVFLMRRKSLACNDEGEALLIAVVCVFGGCAENLYGRGLGPAVGPREVHYWRLEVWPRSRLVRMLWQ